MSWAFSSWKKEHRLVDWSAKRTQELLNFYFLIKNREDCGLLRGFLPPLEFQTGWYQWWRGSWSRSSVLVGWSSGWRRAWGPPAGQGGQVESSSAWQNRMELKEQRQECSPGVPILLYVQSEKSLQLFRIFNDAALQRVAGVKKLHQEAKPISEVTSLKLHMVLKKIK